MKTLITTLIAVNLFCCFASAEKLISVKQFKKLSKAQQVRYLKGVQNILVNMTDKSPYMAELVGKADRVPASGAPPFKGGNEDFTETDGNGESEGEIGGEDVSFAQGSENKNNQSQKNNTAATSTSNAQATTPAGTKPAAPAASRPAGANQTAASSQSSPNSRDAAERSLAPGESIVPQAAEAAIDESRTKPGLAPASRNTETTSTDSKQKNDEKEKQKEKERAQAKSQTQTQTQNQNSASPAAGTFAAAKATSTSAYTSMKETPPFTPAANVTPANPTNSPASSSSQNTSTSGSAEAAAKNAATSTSEDSATKSGSTYRCMYAGFVIEKGECTGLTKIPSWLGLGMKESNMSCGKGEAVCMPLLFGLKLPENCLSYLECQDKAKPICVRKGRRPTWDCRQAAQANGAKATKVAVELITEVVPNKYDDYEKMFSDLCGTREQIAENPFVKNRNNPKDAKRALDDIDKTCRKAEEQLDDLMKSVGVDGNESTSSQGNSQTGNGSAPPQGNGGAQK